MLDVQGRRQLYSRPLPGVQWSIAWSPDGRLLGAGTNDGRIFVLRPNDGTPIHTLRGHKGPVNQVRWSPDGRRIGSVGDDGTLRIWDAATGDAVIVLEGEGGAIKALAWSPDSRRLACYDADGCVRFWGSPNTPAATATHLETGILASHVAAPLAVPGHPAAVDADGQLHLAQLLSLNGHHEEARARLQEATALRPARDRALAVRADLAMRSGRYAEAETACRGLVGLAPRSAAHHFELGRALLGQGKAAEAEARFAEVAELTGKNAARLNSAAWRLVTHADVRLRHAPSAVSLARKAVELAPKEGAIWNTLGVAEYRAGAWKESVAALQRSMALRNGGDGNDWFFLAMAHQQLGKPDEARRWLAQAVRWAEKHRPHDEEMLRFRAEAEALLNGS
jgi:Tfp pilus assembly protein PilF